MHAPHIPVMGREVVDMLQVHANGTYIDGTLGACGYTTMMLAGGAGDGHRYRPRPQRHPRRTRIS